jgi:putative redox protein
MRVELRRVGPAAFAAAGESGGEVMVDGAPEIGGRGRGMRPMELLLTALATCAAMDVVHILGRQRQPLEDLEVAVEGRRREGTPSPFSAVHLRFVAHGPVDPRKLERAVRLGVERYCSVGATLDPDVTVTWEATLAG